MADIKKQEQQFMEAYDKYADAIFRYCYYRVFDRDKAKDFVQEAFCRTWKYMIGGHQIDNIRAFVYRTAKNIIIDDSRKKKSFSLNQIMEKGFSPAVDPREKMQSYFAGQEILNIVQFLDEKYKDVIIMKYINNFSTKEIASLLNETENNVYVKINRGFQKIKELLKHQES